MTSDLVLPSDDDGPEDPHDDGELDSLVLPSEDDGCDFEIPESLAIPCEDDGAAPLPATRRNNKKKQRKKKAKTPLPRAHQAIHHRQNGNHSPVRQLPVGGMCSSTPPHGASGSLHGSLQPSASYPFRRRAWFSRGPLCRPSYGMELHQG